MKITPFRAARPPADLAPAVSVLPYDVVTLADIKSEAKNPNSFFHVTRSEIDLLHLKNPYEPEVYEKSADALKTFLEKGFLVKDEKSSFYIYQESFLERTQTGLVALVSIEEYKNNLIKKHELTRKDKELDRVNHILKCQAHTEPVFLTIKESISLNEFMKKNNLRYDFTSSDQVTHKLWQVDGSADIKKLTGIFAKIPCSYIADGHHRAAAALEVSKELNNKDFMAVIFPAEELLVLPYHRVVKDHQNLGWAKIKSLAEKYFDFSKGPRKDPKKDSVTKKHEFGAYAENQWLKMTAKKNICDDSDAIKTLDVYILQEYFLKNIFGISDPRTDKNIDFIGGVKGQIGIEEYCKKNKNYIGLSLHSTSVNEMIAVADLGLVMPPKSTWFEPKLRSGLFLNLIDRLK